MTLERLIDLALHGKLIASARGLDRLRSHDRSGPQAAWLRAYLANATGDFALAEAIAVRLVRAGQTPELRARAAVTLGSVLRQTGRHARAREIDEAAQAEAPTPELRAHLGIGLAADAVGVGDLRAVRAALRRVPAAGGWRVAVRLRWVRCERDLLARRPKAAIRHATDAVARSRRAGARRHEAKSLLFLGAALREAGDVSRADRALRGARALAVRIGAEPLAEVAGALLGGRGRGDLAGRR